MPGKEDYAYALIYVASIQRGIGPSVQRIRRFLGSAVTEEQLSKASWRLRTNGIWRGGRIYSEVGSVPGADAIALSLEIMCAAGIVEHGYSGRDKWLKYTRAHEKDAPPTLLKEESKT